MKKAKILQIFTILNKGGAETNVLNYLRHMDRERFQIDFLVHRAEKGAYENEIVELGSKIFRLPPIHPFYLNQYKRDVKKFFDENSDYDIIHGQLSELGVFIYEEAKKRKIPVIIAHAHNNPVGFDKKSIFRFIWKKRMNHSINERFTCGKDAAIWLFGKEKAHLAYQMNNAIETNKFVWDKEKAQKIREKENIAGNLNFINIGRFNTQKNHIFLLEVFSEILKIKSNAKLYLVGDGELKPEILKYIDGKKLTDHVRLLGVRSDVNEILQAMNYFIFPSRFEGLGIAFIEAQTSGIKCFISDGVPSEAVLVEDNVKVISLKKSAKEWAEIIFNNLEYNRTDTSHIIREKGYDIIENAKNLEEKYLELLHKYTQTNH